MPAYIINEGIVSGGMFIAIGESIITRAAALTMAADDITEEYATAMEEAIESATKAESERDTALARVAELEASLSKFEPKFQNPAPRPVYHKRYTIETRPYMVNIYTKDGNFWVEGERFEFFEFDISREEIEAATARITKRRRLEYIEKNRKFDG